MRRRPRREARTAAAQVDMTARVGTVVLPNPVMTASGTAGHGAELGAYFDLSALGAVVVKSLSVEPWAGNPAPRLFPAAAGMLNSVGLQNPGVAAWLKEDLAALGRAGARVNPQLPMTTVVMPWKQEHVPSTSHITWASMWV